MPVLNSKWYDGRDAEWIVERPTSAAGSLWPLQDFYRISWHSVQAQNSKNDWYYLADLHEKINVTMQNSPADILATTSDIGGTNGGVFQSLYQFCV